jgi:3-oxoacyl-[acyl-carrier protein] reductase
LEKAACGLRGPALFQTSASLPPAKGVAFAGYVAREVAAMDLELKGRKAIITGASKGIGFATAKLFADEGVDVAICARTTADVEKAVAELKAKGINAFGDSIDVTNADQYMAWVDGAARRLGGLDIFVHNVTASPSTPGMRGWELAYETDIMGAVRGVEAALPHMKQSAAAKARNAAIVMISSISGVMSKVIPTPGAYAYGTAKAALISYGAQLSKDVAKHGIRVNIISPGPIYFEGGPWDRVKARMPQAYQAAIETCVIGRLGAPEDIANTVAFLASPRSGFTVGQNIHIDGGYMQHVPF